MAGPRAFCGEGPRFGISVARLVQVPLQILELVVLAQQYCRGIYIFYGLVVGKKHPP